MNVRRLAALLGLASAIAAIGACRGGHAGTPETTPADEAGRFPHGSHAGLACVDCHALSAVLAGRPAVPGAADHQPCDRSGCHREAFLRAPGPLCKVCHPSVDPTASEAAAPVAYPPRRGRRALAASFSHARHLDYAAMERQVGFHVSCGDCHSASDSGEPTSPDHAVCGRCHAPEATPPGAPSMGQCGACHQAGNPEPLRRRRLIVGDLHFQHGNHRNDRTGKPILCTECHAGTAAVTRTGGHAPPTTATCVECHDDSNRTPGSMKMRACATCHRSEDLGVTQIPPRSHLPAPDRPTDHTLAFRSDHGADARRDARRCARCHTLMSGASRNVCDECHQMMRPRDHTLLWREYDHGGAARDRSERCVTCHQGDFCSSCHARPPRSHTPLLEFAQRGHAGIARFDLRACLTCHDADRDCTGSGCHTVRPR